MFRDYYSILEIEQNASQEEIKTSFKRQALKWHPDRNQGTDTTAKMQAINEAKLILLDEEARAKYDIEYNRFRAIKFDDSKETYKENQKKYRDTGKTYTKEWEGFEPEINDYEYEVEDEELHRWMKNAKRQSVDLAKKTIEDLKGMVKAGATAAAKEAVSVFTIQITLGFIIFFFIMLSRACNH